MPQHGFFMRRNGGEWFKINGRDFLAYELGIFELQEGEEIARFD